ncbi:hypothetical protein GCM10012280_41760 [Wenjunlia tyrosinilytica]|uniref:Peptidase S33 tripeptidyl aminopeptidase-like C-terminal domain-containing protein n=2 Tax=Wenjunlia tyrosinilytica TaxID=1544741 RepID=A0A917ZS88_9ACTN|nr:hypothetical protein GCM10012280_41760 [Wenjunlia tyrosinilytica]
MRFGMSAAIVAAVLAVAPADAAADRPHPVRDESGQGGSGQAGSGQGASGEGTSGHVGSGHVGSGQVTGAGWDDGLRGGGVLQDRLLRGGGPMLDGLLQDGALRQDPALQGGGGLLHDGGLQREAALRGGGGLPGVGALPLSGEVREAGAETAAGEAYAAGVHFSACPKAARLPAPIRCGRVEVPLDYSRPHGARISLMVSRAKATGTREQRQGSLLYNPGGPGGSGLSFPLALTRKSPNWTRVAKAYDFVGFDPRGVGQSTRVSCEDPKTLAKGPSPDPDPTSAADKSRRVAKAKAYAEGCRRRSAKLLPHMTTANVARDLHVLKAALHDDRLNFLGASYGTYIGGVYATFFPGDVRRMVLDSAVNPAPDHIWYRNNMDQNVAFETRWRDFRTWVARHDSVYHLGRTAAAVQRSYDKVRKELIARPAGGKVGAGELQAAYLLTGYYDMVWADSASALSQYVRGNPERLVALAAKDPAQAADDENGSAVYTAIQCADAPWPRDWKVWDRDSTRVARRAPFETWDNTWMNLPCAFWKGPKGRPVDVGAGTRGRLAPVMIVAAERDAATPYAGAVELRRRLSGSVLVTERDSGSHGVTDLPNPCVNHRVVDYLLHGDAGPASEGCPSHGVPLASGTGR